MVGCKRINALVHVFHHSSYSLQYIVILYLLIHLQVKYRCSELLKHKLVSSFLRQKSTFGAAFYLAEFFLYVLFLVFLTVYALIVPTPLDDICELNRLRKFCCCFQFLVECCFVVFCVLGGHFLFACLFVCTVLFCFVLQLCAQVL